MLLLGYATWIATVVFVVGLIFAAGLLWWVYFKGQPATATVQKIAWVTALFDLRLVRGKYRRVRSAVTELEIRQ
ncbi:hypothetical protein GS854_00455 [Rhodococcus hoagii]|nr:hypothetical protein [Prescottella equi]